MLPPDQVTGMGVGLAGMAEAGLSRTGGIGDVGNG